MLSTTAEYALRALIHLAAVEDSQAVPAHEVAAVLGAPANYLSKTLNALTRAGLVEAVRGRGGGFRMAASASEITLARVADLFDGSRPTDICLLSDHRCPGQTPCAAHETWAAVQRDARSPLLRTTIQDLVPPVASQDDRSHSHP